MKWHGILYIWYIYITFIVADPDEEEVTQVRAIIILQEHL